MFLDGLLVVYGPALIVTVVGTLSLLGLRLRARHSLTRLTQSRFLLLGLSVLLSFLAIEAGAAAWRAWLHHSPKLPAVASNLEAAHATTDAAPDPGLPKRFPVASARRERKSLADLGDRRVERTGRAVPSLAFGRSDRRLAIAAGICGTADSARQLGFGRGHPRGDAQQAGGFELPARRPDRVCRPQRVPGPLLVDA